MTRAEHINLWLEHNELALNALKRWSESLIIDDWIRYKEESRIAHRHYGVASAMLTKAMKKHNIF